MKERMLYMAIAVALLFCFASCGQKMSLKEVKPSSGVMGGGENVTIFGSGLTKGQGLIVYFGSRRAPHAYIEGNDKIIVTTPSYGEATLVDVRVIDESGDERILKKAFMYLKSEKWTPFDAYGGKKK